ncbi:MAG: 30S ribosomal protein S27ae [Candidatus Woesearchaeota archaeon]
MAKDSKGGKKPDSKGKKEKSKKPYNASKVFEISGNSISAKNKKCPKCSVFMANHKDRYACGKCGYTEFK